MVSESLTINADGMAVPTLEKILVDTQADADFDYLRGSESRNMFDRAFSLLDMLASSGTEPTANRSFADNHYVNYECDTKNIYQVAVYYR